MTGSLYDTIRSSVNETGTDARVEVNQRALIDKILARYASANAVYRELIQNSNDANATVAEIVFTTADSDNTTVSQVLYRNNGMPFRPQDWSRLQKIAEGNPDVSKIGAFGVGAYTMFSICEEPLVISGKAALAFLWKGDALWTKTALNTQPDSEWTSFILPSRDPYALPDLTEFGKFLCSSLTFTKSLAEIRVIVNNKKRMVITKTQIQPPTVVNPPKSSSWWKNDGAILSSPRGLFSLASEKSILETMYHIQVSLDGETASIRARYVSGIAKTRIPADMARRMERVTKKNPPTEVTVDIFINGQEDDTTDHSKASQIVQSFSPQQGSGRIFIGFRTSQTTGLAAHLSAPFVPTVEREAMDLQDPTLCVFNTEMLEFCGILMRLTLEHTMSLVGVEWQKNTAERQALERKLEAEQAQNTKSNSSSSESAKKADSQDEDDETVDGSMTGGLMGFARFMAKGVKKKIVNVLSTVQSYVVDDGTNQLNPPDPRPLSAEERQAILLMRSFCPQQSTPDPMVGFALAQGFSRCLPNMAPPVLTRSGVVRGDQSRLSHHGIEAFVQNNVIRKVVYQNAEQYHDVIARCRRLTLDDLVETLTIEVLDEKRFVNFLKWWTKYSRIDSAGTMTRAALLRNVVRFTPEHDKTEPDVVTVHELKNIPYYLDKEKMAANTKLPMPDVVMNRQLQQKIGLPVLGDVSLKAWFGPLPMEVWAEFVSRHPIMTAGQPEDEPVRIHILLMLSNEYSLRPPTERVVFGSFCQTLFGDKRCLPFDSLEPTKYAAECPCDLYLYSAELKAFDAIGSFHKVSQSLKNAGVTEEFLLALGVRKSVSIDFLFSNLDTLRWSDDPRPLIEYLRSASLTHQDMVKLKSTQYLPAENDITRSFAPSELYFPDHDLRIFPFVRLLQWPSEDELTERTANGKFLAQLGMMVNPPLQDLLQYVSNDVRDDQLRIRCLDFICKYMGSNGVYQRDFARIRSISQLRFLPCVWKSPLDGSESRELHSPVSCYSNAACGVLGFPVFDPKLEAGGKLYGSLFHCASEPGPDILIRQLLHVVASAKSKLQGITKPSEQQQVSQKIMLALKDIFNYLSSRSTEIKSTSIASLTTERFIPCMSDGALAWYQPEEVFFQNSHGSGDSLTEQLFRVVEFSPFLAAAGVKQEATTQDLFRLLTVQPQQVLKKLGSEAKYRQLLRRIAANAPFRQVTPQIRNAPFLLAYRIAEGKAGETTEETCNYLLAKAEDIFLIDNSMFGRMFKVNRAPQESDLEEFYSRLGSPYISKRVQKDFEVIGRLVNNTELTRALGDRIRERTPLLVSPGVTSRPLLSGAAAILGEKNLVISEASDLKAVYTLGDAVRRQRITCCPNALGGRRNALYVTRDFDWFDVAYAIGGLILERCELENAFLISSLLEAPLEQLRARGFPVDRVVKLEPLPEPAPPPPPAPPVLQSVASANGQHNAQPIVDPIASRSTLPDDKLQPVTAKVPPQPAPTPVQRPPEARPNDASTASQLDEGFPEILHQMFPDCSKDFIREQLGDKPNLDKVQELAEQLSHGKYPQNSAKNDKVEDHHEPLPPSVTPEDSPEPLPPSAAPGSPPKKKKSGIGKKLGKAFGGLRGSHFGGATVQTAAATSVGPPVPGSKPGFGNEALTHDTLEQQLRQAVKTSTSVDSRGVNSTETLLTNIPEGLDRGSTCEVLPGHTLMPFSGPHRNGKARNGIRVFSARNDPKTAEFLHEQFHAVESFADVLQNLAVVFGVDLASIAIFHDFDGGAIAFNSNRSMYFNLRFFFTLHYTRGARSSRGCYSYWYVTFSHELAHHFVGNHNKEHGFYTECFTMTYLPKLMSLLERIENS